MPASFSDSTSRSWCSFSAGGHLVPAARRAPRAPGAPRTSIRASRSPAAIRAAPASSRATGAAMERPMRTLTATATSGAATRSATRNRRVRRSTSSTSAPHRADRRLEPLDERLGEVLDAGHDELGAPVLLLDVLALAAQHRRHDPLAEDAVEPLALLIDRVHERPLLRPLGRLPERAGEPRHRLARLAVEPEVRGVPDDDGVGLVGVLVAHRARELEREPDALLAPPRLGERRRARARSRRARPPDAAAMSATSAPKPRASRREVPKPSGHLCRILPRPTVYPGRRVTGALSPPPRASRVRRNRAGRARSPHPPAGAPGRARYARVA